ncbi:hypothetical protein GCM10020295_57750 [Streptomyces cinereospinus]
MAPTTYQLPDGRAWARFSAAAITAGRASRQVGRCRVQATGCLRSRSGNLPFRPALTRPPRER